MEWKTYNDLKKQIDSLSYRASYLKEPEAIKEKKELIEKLTKIARHHYEKK